MDCITCVSYGCKPIQSLLWLSFCTEYHFLLHHLSLAPFKLIKLNSAVTQILQRCINHIPTSLKKQSNFFAKIVYHVELLKNKVNHIIT